MTDERKSELFSELIKGIDGLLDDETFYSILRDIGMTHREIETVGRDLREQYPRQYTALEGLCERLSTFVEYVAGEYERRLEQGDRAELSLADLSHQYDLDLYDNKTLRDTATAMIAERLDDPELEFEVDKNELIITRAPEMEMGMGM